MNVFNNIILARNRQLPDDDRMIETCQSILKSFNANNLSVCNGWCADQVTLQSAQCNDKDGILKVCYKPFGTEQCICFNTGCWVQFPSYAVYA